MDPFNPRHVIKQCYRTAYSTARVGVIYIVSLMGIQALANITSTKIKSPERLEQLVEIERRKIDPYNNSEIRAMILSKDYGKSTKLSDQKYTIEMGGFLANETTLRHELYHILDSHFDNGFDFRHLKSSKSEFLTFVKYLLYEILSS